MEIKVVVQSRHIHLSQEDQDLLFGENFKLTPLASIGHHGQVVYQETVGLAGKKGRFDQIRIIGPIRTETQAELSEVDLIAAGIEAPVRLSGDSLNAGEGILIGPAGQCSIDRIIIPARHLHLSNQQAQDLGLRQHQRVKVREINRPEQIIKEVIVRIHPTFSPEFHLTDHEAANFWLQTGQQIILV